MAKFKVGDKVMVRSDLNENGRYYSEDYETWGDCVGDMIDLRGKTVTIKEVGRTGKYVIFEGGYSWTDDMFSGLATEHPRREFVVIRRSGAETIAELRHDREVIKSAKATCAPSDTFDFVNKGAILAFDRLMGREEPKPVPQPAHKFKVGDRVITPVGAGYIKQVDANSKLMPYYISYDRGVSLWRRSDEAKPEPAPAPEPPKFYTGKVVCVENNRFPEKIGMIASVSNGRCSHREWDSMFGIPYKSFEGFCYANSHAKFIEVKSDV